MTTDGAGCVRKRRDVTSFALLSFLYVYTVWVLLIQRTSRHFFGRGDRGGRTTTRERADASVAGERRGRRFIQRAGFLTLTRRARGGFLASLKTKSNRIVMMMTMMTMTTTTQKVTPTFQSRARRARPRGRGVRVTASVSADSSRSLEYMVEMRCGKCATKVENAVNALGGTKSVEASLGTNTVRVVTSDRTETVSEAIEACGYKVRLIGQGDVDAFGEALASALGTDLRTLRQSLAAVAEFKGEKYNHGDVKGTVRFVQVNEEVILAEAALDGLTPGKHAICVHESGDLTRGIESVGRVYACEEDDDKVGAPSGLIAVVEADENGTVKMPSTILSGNLKTWDVIGRSVGVHATETPSVDGGIAAVLARSAGVGENHKKLCQCDGTVIWEAGEDFLPVSVGAEERKAPLIGKTTTIRRG